MAKRDLVCGDIIYVSGDSKQLWIEDYNVNVDTTGIVAETPSKNAKKVLVILDTIDGDGKVLCYARKSKIFLLK